LCTFLQYLDLCFLQVRLTSHHRRSQLSLKLVTSTHPSSTSEDFQLDYNKSYNDTAISSNVRVNDHIEFRFLFIRIYVLKLTISTEDHSDYLGVFVGETCSLELLFGHLCTLLHYAASRGKRNVTVWRPSVRRSVSAVGAYSTWLTKEQHVTRPAYISVRILRKRTHLLFCVFRGNGFLS